MAAINLGGVKLKGKKQTARLEIGNDANSPLGVEKRGKSDFPWEPGRKQTGPRPTSVDCLPCRSAN